MAEASNHRWRPTLKRRVLVAAVMFLLWAIGIEARLVYLQVFQHDELVARVKSPGWTTKDENMNEVIQPNQQARQGCQCSLTSLKIGKVHNAIFDFLQ